jgi:Flp pilus assembly secretin CpaC
LNEATMRGLRILAMATTSLALAMTAAANDISVALDQARGLSLGAPAKGVVIGNPTIAGVTIQNERLLFVTGKSYGTTNLIVVGEDGRAIYSGRITVVPDETGAVIVNRGGWTVRFDCAPECRRRPDISEDPQAFVQTTEQIRSRGK